MAKTGAAGDDSHSGVYALTGRPHRQPQPELRNAEAPKGTPAGSIALGAVAAHTIVVAVACSRRDYCPELSGFFMRKTT
jgi:hypothetical protein